jgi:hypothetical protein
VGEKRGPKVCGYLGSELVQKCRQIRDLETDLAELVRKDREGRGGQVQAARRVLAWDEGARAVLEGVAGAPETEMDRRAREMPWLMRVREGVEG